MGQDWERFRKERTDLTDYVVHFTKRKQVPQEDWQKVGKLGFTPREVLLQILDDGFIRPGFAPLPNRYSREAKPTVYGPHAAICFTEQTLEAVVTSSATKSRYSGFGIAYHKVLLHEQGGRPVIYGTEEILGTRIRSGEEGFEEGRRIYRGGLSLNAQHLFVRYQPEVPGSGTYPLDFMWEREWRLRPRNEHLPVAMEHWALNQKGIYSGAIIVDKDADVEIVRNKLLEQQAAGKKWLQFLGPIISLEETKRRLEAGERGCGRIETWPPPEPEEISSVST